MQVFVFRSQVDTTIYAVTDDRIGADLPFGLAPWDAQSGQIVDVKIDPKAGGHAVGIILVSRCYGFYLLTLPAMDTRNGCQSSLQ